MRFSEIVMTETAEPEWLDEEEQRAWRNYLRGSAQVSARINSEMFAEHKITLNKYEVLVRLSESPTRTMRMSDLADDLVHSRSRLTRAVKSMEEEGYLVRESCSGDRRGINCRLTDYGYERLQAIAADHVASVRRHLVDRLGRDRLIELGSIMTDVVDDESIPETP